MQLFLGGLPFEANEQDIRADFGKYGELEDVQVPVDDTGRHKGFGFVTYRDAADAKDAAKEHHQREYRGHEISARVVVPRDQRPSSQGGYRGGGGGGGGGRSDDRRRDDRYDDRRRDDRFDDLDRDDLRRM